MTLLYGPYSLPVMTTERTELVAVWLTRDEAARRLGVSVRTIDRYISGGQLPAHRLPGGRLIRIKENDLQALAESGRAA